MIFKCPCKECDLFHDEENIGWEDIGCGHLVHCEDGKTRHVDINNGCGNYKPVLYINISNYIQ